VVTTSWGACEAGVSAATQQADDNIFANANAIGQSWFAASGDAGSRDCSNVLTVDNPANSPHVIGVGGTKPACSGGLTSASPGCAGYGSEIGWSGSGGGVSQLFARPSFQVGCGIPPGSQRLVPDVALEADTAPGNYVIENGVWYTVGGTSGAAPQWAGFLAQFIGRSGAPVGNPGALLYGACGTAAFHDVTSGSNGDYTAGPLYDPVTGIGSIEARNFLALATAATTTTTTVPTTSSTSTTSTTSTTIAGTTTTSSSTSSTSTSTSSTSTSSSIAIVSTSTSSTSTSSSQAPMTSSSSTTTPVTSTSTTSLPAGGVSTYQAGVSGRAGSANVDTNIRLDTSSTNLGTDPNLYVGVTNGPTKIFRTIMAFDLADIPAGATVTACRLTVNVTQRTSPTVGHVRRLCAEHWLDGDARSETQATWLSWKTGTTWTTAGAGAAGVCGSGVDYTTTNEIAYAPPVGTGSFTFPDISPLCQDAIAAQGGWLRLRISQDAESTQGSLIKFDSSDATTATTRPKLSVTWR
jgi:hypothetical protein